ncbi:helix-turn-helix domain-containing protein [Streptococcus equi]|uniref:helix-turn-helix domain-containing protein n=1 Tax=Streptococcus equi TaxID=1336 RepID=UPI001BB59763|nr:helix-turn-helix transcriptional regulator [Streptococcus equi]MBT1194114.1 helix-turn-helix transcriptional regulator [Streptococcus equi subsp. equi]MCD3371763.1 helix-turn-helix domain-containing protein [Streptococcus equi subsp. zooepidemicus]MCD3373099.1 helix-turn-helix domain-containing protein [Streptococcus equi subsp. zooepidemicus]MCD3373101.1 helix-turn-helix domain-containing protein [Streptococcus equi subsp. zooepidemicus]MCD3373119.1 helix-turn-helix domain-containing prote
MSDTMVMERPYLNLKSIIVSKGLKQKDIAKKLDMDKSTFNMKVNRYKGRDFTFSEASQLSKLLDVKMEDF